MTKQYWKRMKPKILAPINSFEGAVRVIRAGADELYCGVAIPGKLKNFKLYRGPGKTPAAIPTYDELSKIVNCANKNRVKVVLVVNEPFMSEALENEIERHIKHCLDEGVDALIIGDFGVLSIIKRMKVKVPLYASTYFASMNSEAVDFLRRSGFSRVILERHLTIPEIAQIVKNSKFDIEVFCHGGGCSNINTNCYLHYYEINPAFDLEIWWMRKRKSATFTTPCALNFEIYDVDDRHTMICKAPILDAGTYCSLCKLSALVKTGISGIKIVGREVSVEEQESSTKAYRKLLDLIVNKGGASKEQIHLIRKELKKMGQPDFSNAFREVYCKHGRCYFSPLFHIPYEKPQM